MIRGTVGPREGTFMWAVEHIKKNGGKFKCIDFDFEHHYELDEEGFLIGSNGVRQEFTYDMLRHNYEIYEEPEKTLWDKRHDDTLYDYKDVKEALKEFIRFLVLPEGKKDVSTRQKAREIFGKELVE